MKTQLTPLLALVTTLVCFNSVNAQENWGSPEYKSKVISKQLEENERVLGVAYKVQCRYFSTHKDSSLKDERSAKFFKNEKEDMEKLNNISKSMTSFIDSYCSGKEKLNPESMAGSVLSKCLSDCRASFKSSLEFMGKYETDKTRSCENSCHEYVSRFEQIAKTTIEADKMIRSKS